MGTLSQKKAVTLVELLAVIVIIGIIAAISVVMIGKLYERTEARANEQIVASLNQATEYFCSNTGISSSTAFDDLETNGQRISLLFNNGYLSSLPQPKPPVSFSWDKLSQLWILTEETEIVVPSNVTYDFTSTRLVDVVENGGVITLGSFVDTGSSIDSGYGLLFIGNPKSEYTIDVTAKLSSGTVGGYGIFFETKLNEALKETGLIVQFDRSYSNGEIVIRPHTDGNEGSPVLRFPILFDNGGAGDWVLTGGVKNNQNPWWTAQHVITLVVTVSDQALASKVVQVYIDEVFVLQYAFTSSISSGETSVNQTGFRSWGKLTQYIGIEIS